MPSRGGLRLAVASMGSLSVGIAIGYSLARRRRQNPDSSDAAPVKGQSDARAGVTSTAPLTGNLLQLFLQLPLRPLARGENGANQAATAGRARAVFVVASGKGGVGKSTICVNVAYALKQLGLNVGIVDLDIYGPSLPELIPMPPNSLCGTEDGMLVPFDYSGVGLMSWGYIQPGEAAVIRAPLATRRVAQLLSNVRWGDLDCLLIDTPPGTGDILLTLTQHVQIDGAVLVTTTNGMSVADLTKGAELFEKVNVPVLAVCENMASLLCERCGHEHRMFSDAAASRIPALLQTSPNATLHVLPLDPQLSRAPPGPVRPQFYMCPYMNNPDFDDRPASRALRGLAEALLATFLAARQKPGERAEVRIRSGGSLQLRLPGGDVRPLSCCKLRAACRCAKCVDEDTGEQLLDKERILRDGSLRALLVEPVGNYAIRVQWSDNHISLVSLKIVEQLAGGLDGGSASPIGAGSW